MFSPLVLCKGPVVAMKGGEGVERNDVCNWWFFFSYSFFLFAKNIIQSSW